MDTFWKSSSGGLGLTVVVGSEELYFAPCSLFDPWQHWWDVISFSLGLNITVSQAKPFVWGCIVTVFMQLHRLYTGALDLHFLFSSIILCSCPLNPARPCEGSLGLVF
uniref:Uncharacterized protein n=1 Tax=Opuntia streptacantha TaxID=393608 RepID=A0A7C9ATN3_OPUST